MNELNRAGGGLGTVRRLAVGVALGMSMLAGPLAARAGMIGADEVAAAQAGSQAPAAVPAATDAVSSQARLQAALDRADVQAALLARGVDPAQVRARVEALSDAEAAQLLAQVDQAPAAGDSVLGVLVFIFVLLLITDILGLTKVFPFTRSVRH